MMPPLSPKHLQFWFPPQILGCTPEQEDTHLRTMEAQAPGSPSKERKINSLPIPWQDDENTHFKPKVQI